MVPLTPEVKRIARLEHDRQQADAARHLAAGRVGDTVAKGSSRSQALAFGK
jgi:hypothetical protein